MAAPPGVGVAALAALIAPAAVLPNVQRLPLAIAIPLAAHIVAAAASPTFWRRSNA